MSLGGVAVLESTDRGEEVEEEAEALCPICLDPMMPGRAVRVLPRLQPRLPQGLRRPVARHLAPLPCLQRLGCAAVFACDLAVGAQDRLGFLMSGRDASSLVPGGSVLGPLRVLWLGSDQRSRSLLN